MADTDTDTGTTSPEFTPPTTVTSHEAPEPPENESDGFIPGEGDEDDGDVDTEEAEADDEAEDDEAEKDADGKDKPKDDDPKVKLKFNRKEEELPLSEVVKLAQMYKASEDRLELAKKAESEIKGQWERIHQVQNQINDFKRRAKAGDMSVVEDVFSQLGMNWDEIALKRAIDIVQFRNLPQAEQEAIMAKRKVEQYEAREKLRAQQEAMHRLQIAEQESAKILEHVMPAAWQEVAGSAPTKSVVKAMADVWNAALQQGRLPEAKTKDEFLTHARIVADYVRQQREADKEDDLSQMDAETLLAKLGPKAKDVVAALNKKAPKPVAKRENLRHNQTAGGTGSNGTKYVPWSQAKKQFGY